MSNVINRTTKQYKESVNTPDYPVADWIINPDLSALTSVPEKYWKIVGDDVVEMTQTEKDTVDTNETQSGIAGHEAHLKARMFPDPTILSDHNALSSASGLTITSSVSQFGLNDTTNVTADATDTKYAIIKLIYNSTTDTFLLTSYEKTTGAYATLAADELLLATVKEYSVVANGTTLTEV